MSDTTDRRCGSCKWFNRFPEPFNERAVGAGLCTWSAVRKNELPSVIGGHGHVVNESNSWDCPCWQAKTTEVPKEDTKPPANNVMLYENGCKTSFRCSCRANVFKRTGTNSKGEYLYECNGCGARYIGEAKTPTTSEGEDNGKATV